MERKLDSLLKKYERSGPRYTSYPTAPAWTDRFGPEQYGTCLATLDRTSENGPARPISLYVHIPFCRHRCLYCGCNVVISPEDRLSPRYLDALEREVREIRTRLRAPGAVHQLHLGGGTPTYLTPVQLRRLQSILTANFELDDDAEISIEVDPAVTGEDHVRTLRELGYNRISMGVQDLDPRVQAAVERIQPEELTERFYTLCRESGFESINIDLIYGLPFQTLDSFRHTVDRVLQWAPDRVAVFNYAHVPWLKPHQKKIDIEALPDSDTRFAIFLQTRDQFLQAGYETIGLDHFARPEDELAIARRRGALRRNFMGYTTRPETDLLAFGASAISEVSGAYAQNEVKLIDYMRIVERGELPTRRGAQLSTDDTVRRAVIMDLMCNGALVKARIERRHEIVFDAYFAKELAALTQFATDGLLESTADGVALTELGQLLVRNVAMVFDAYLEPTRASAIPLYSRTV